MKKSVLSPEEKKARKAASVKAYRARKKAGLVARPIETVEEPAKAKPTKPKKEAPSAAQFESSFTKAFGFPVRLYWNQRIEEVNSSCAKPGTELTFEEMGTKGKATLYRVRRGKRNFFTTSTDLAEQEG